LDANTFKQVSGRAGRRGHETQGHIIFYDFPADEIRALWNDRPQTINTESALTLDNILKSIILVNSKEGNNDLTCQRLEALLHPPLTDNTDEDFDTRSKHMKATYKLSLEILYGLNMINEKGQAIGLAGLAAHVPEAYPFNFLLPHLIMTGSLDQIMQPYSREYLKANKISFPVAEKMKLRARTTMVSILSHFLCRRRRVGDRLTALPRGIERSVTSYNRSLLRCKDNFNTVTGSHLNTSYRVVPVAHCEDGDFSLNIIPWMTELFANKHWHGTMSKCNLTDSTMYHFTSKLISAMRKISTALRELSAKKEDGYAEIFTDITTVFESVLAGSR